MTDYDINELTKAGFLELACPPASPEAKALVNDIINIIEQSEQRQRARTAEHNAAFRSAVGLIVGDLLIAMEEREHGWSYHGLSPAAFDDQPVGYKTFKPIVETMEAVGLIVISKGRNSKAPQFDEGTAPSYHPSLATRFRPTQAMVSMAEEAGVCHGSARKHFPQQLPDNVIEVRGTSTSVRGVKTKGKKLKFAHFLSRTQRVGQTVGHFGYAKSEVSLWQRKTPFSEINPMGILMRGAAAFLIFVISSFSASAQISLTTDEMLDLGMASNYYTDPENAYSVGKAVGFIKYCPQLSKNDYMKIEKNAPNWFKLGATEFSGKISDGGYLNSRLYNKLLKIYDEGKELGLRDAKRLQRHRDYKRKLCPTFLDPEYGLHGPSTRLLGLIRQ